jgi:hypothetical protein
MSRFSFGDKPLSQAFEGCFRILVVDADPAFDGDRNAHGFLHRRHASGDQCGLGHQAGAETTLLHPVRRTTDIEVDFVVTEILADLCRRREIARIRAAELKRHGMFASIEAKQALPVTVKDGARGQHLRVEAAAPGHQAVEHPAMPVGPVHHGCTRKEIVFIFQ